MKDRNHSQLHTYVVPGLCVAVLFLLLAARFDFYYDLNDDFLMDRILSGAYTGEPEARNIQSLFPLTALLAALFRVARRIDWYALLLLALQMLALFLPLHRVMVLSDNSFGRIENNRPRFSRKWRVGAKILGLILGITLFLGELYYHLIFVQYSVTVGMLAGCVIFLIMTEPGEGLFDAEGRIRAAKVLRQNVPVLILIVIAFLLRSEMLLFCGPFIALAAVYGGVELARAAEAGGGMSSTAIQNTASVATADHANQKDSLSSTPDRSSGTVGRGQTERVGRTHTKSGRALRNAVVYVLTIGLAAGVCIGVCKAGDIAGYKSKDWQEFEAFFDARTQLYDFQRDWLKTYEEDREFYDSISMDAAEVELLWNYNFGIDDDINAGVLTQVAARAKEHAAIEAPTGERLRTALSDYRYRLSASSEMPYNLIAAVLYGLVVIGAFSGLFETMLRQSVALATSKTASTAESAWTAVRAENTEESSRPADKPRSAGKSDGVAYSAGSVEASAGAEREAAAGIRDFILTLAGALVLFLIRSALYGYLLYHHRPVVRLTHSLYYCEALILVCLLFRGVAHSRRTAALGAAKAIILLAVLLICTLLQGRTVQQEYAHREEVNKSWQEFLTYTAAHPDDYYFADVYSTVDFSEKMFDNSKVTATNWDFAGGWACKSPLWEKKLKSQGLTSMEEALTESQNVFCVQATDRDMDWLNDYYAFRGQDVTVEAVDTIGSDWTVYRVAAQPIID